MAPRRSNICITSADQDSLIALRYYELEAYSAVVTALRAEGNLNENKKNVLKQLQEIFGISNDRHKAEVIYLESYFLLLQVFSVKIIATLKKQHVRFHAIYCSFRLNFV